MDKDYSHLKGYNGNPLLKRINETIEWDNNMIEEYIKCSSDPIYFIESYMKIINVDRGLINFKLYDYQKDIINSFANHRFNIITTARQAGKALPLDTKIPTPIGWKTMEELNVGDLVFSDTGNPIKITAISEIFNNHNCYKIYFDDGSDVIADEEHLWEVNDSFIRTTKQLFINEKKTKFYIRTSKPVKYKKQKINMNPYDLGKWIGEQDSFKFFNIKNKFIPTEYLINDIEVRKDLLRGLKDSNIISEKYGQHSITLSYENQPKLIENIYELLTGLGYKVFRKDNNKTKSVTYYYNEDNKEPRYIERIEKVESVPTKCIVVDSKNHLFLCTKHFIPTHNSTTTCGFILWYILFHSDKTVALLANKGDTAREILGKIQLAYQHLPKWLQQGTAEWNKGSLELENNSRVIASSTSADAIRGYSINLLFIDEAAFIQNWDEFFTSVYPTISSGKETKVALVSCVSKDTYVFSENGLCQVSDFIDYSKENNPNIGYQIPNYKIYGHHKLNDGNIMVNSGKSKTNIIKSSSSILECSTEHKLWACKNGIFNWYKSSELTTDDYISIRYGMNIWGNNDDISDIKINCKNINDLIIPEIITEDLSYFMGLFLAEGYMRPFLNDKNEPIGGQIIITCGDDISSIFNKLNFKYNKYDNFHYTISNKKLYMFLTEFGFDNKLKAKNKIIPKRLLSCSKEIICSFIRGMFDGDGCVRNDGKITYTSSSEEMIDQLRMLLLNLGILTQKYKSIIPPNKKIKVSSTVYTLEICSYDDCILFYELIGFNLERKQERKKLLKKPTRNITKDYIPYGRVIFNNISKNGIHKSNSHVSRKYCLSNNLIKDGICEPYIKWEKIKSITESENDVYDFSLNNNDDFWCHSVVYNGMLGHQTPNGLNHFYSIWVNAIEARNQYNHIKVTWKEVPGRDAKWKKDTLASMNFDQEKFSQEHECVFGSTLITIRDTITNEIKTLPIEEVYKLL